MTCSTYADQGVGEIVKRLSGVLDALRKLQEQMTCMQECAINCTELLNETVQEGTEFVGQGAYAGSSNRSSNLEWTTISNHAMLQNCVDVCGLTVVHRCVKLGVHDALLSPL